MTNAEKTTTDENLDGVFKGDETKETKAEESKETKAEETKEETTEGVTEDKTKDAEPPSAEEKLVPIVALHDERTKRQAIEKELEQYKSKYDVDDNAPDPAEDPAAYERYVEDKMAIKLHKKRLNDSMDAASLEHADYREKEKIFMVLSGYDESLIDQMNNSPNPAQFAYEKGKAYLEDQRVKIEAELLAAAKGNEVIEKEPSDSDKRKEQALSVPDLTKATASGGNSTPAEIDNRDDLSSLF